jgi:hypothetical protein
VSRIVLRSALRPAAVIAVLAYSSIAITEQKAQRPCL